jgi:hypothetical protein
MHLARVCVWVSCFLLGFMRLRGYQPPQENTPRAQVAQLVGHISTNTERNELMIKVATFE